MSEPIHPGLSGDPDPGPMVSAHTFHQECEARRALAEQNAALRATNARLHRRCQLAESAANVTLERCRREGVSLCKVLMGFRHEKLVREIKDLIEPLAKELPVGEAEEVQP